MSLVRQLRLARAPLAAFAAMGIVWGAYAALVPDTKAMLGVDDARFGSLMLATPLAAVASMLLAPRTAPLFGARVLPAAVIMMGAAFLLPGWFAWPWQFAAAMVLVGATNGFLDVTMTARVSAIEAERGVHLMNLNHAAYSFGYAASAIVTGFARTAGATPGMVLTGAGLMVLALSALSFESGVAAPAFHRGGVRGGGWGMVPVWGGLIVLIAFLSENAAENWSALHIERTLGGSAAEGSLGPAILALTMGAGRMAGQVLIGRLSERGLIVGGAIVAAAGLMGVALAPVPGAVYAGLIVMGVGASVIAPTGFAVIGRMTPDRARTLVLARATALGYLGYFFGPPALGLLSQLLTLRWAFVAAALLVLAVPFLLAGLTRAAGQGRVDLEGSR